MRTTWSTRSSYIHIYILYTNTIKSIVTLREANHRQRAHPMIAIVAIMRKSFVPMRILNVRALPRLSITNHMLGTVMMMMGMGNYYHPCKSTTILGKPMNRVVLIVYSAIDIIPNSLSTMIRPVFRVCTRSVRQSMNCSW